MKFLKAFTKKSTNIAKDVIKTTIDGIDEGLNGDNIKEDRAKAKEEREAIRAENEKKDNLVSLVWTIAIIATIVMIVYSIYLSGFKNAGFESIVNTYGITLAIPFLFAVCVSLARRYM